MNWIWDAMRGVYTRLLKVLGQPELVDLRDEFTAAAMAESDQLIERLLVDGNLSIQRWVQDMRVLVRDTYRAQYELAIGGVNSMTQADYGRLGGVLNEQYRYLQGFAEDLAAGRLSPAAGMHRARMYLDGSTQAFERAHAARHDLDLPAYPGDGGTVCRTNCKCRWEIRERKDGWACTWKLGIAEHCEDCLRNSRAWAPLLLPKAQEAT